MVKSFHRSAILAALVFVLGANAPSLVHSQDRPDEHRDQPPPAEHHDTGPAEHRDEHAAPQGDQAARLRRAHPHAAARCHDGFFTTTRTRARACSKHGGIDIWLLP